MPPLSSPPLLLSLLSTKKINASSNQKDVTVSTSSLTDHSCSHWVACVTICVTACLFVYPGSIPH